MPGAMAEPVEDSGLLTLNPILFRADAGERYATKSLLSDTPSERNAMSQAFPLQPGEGAFSAHAGSLTILPDPRNKPRRFGKTAPPALPEQRRTDAVTGYLTRSGVPPLAIEAEAYGEANPRVPTADGVRELQNRRVEIRHGQSPRP